MKMSKALPAVIVGLILVVGAVAGAGIWLIDSGVPVNYDEPLSIRMSDEERYDEWQNISFKSTTTRPEANFSASQPQDHYYTYFELDNPGVDNVKIEVAEPDGWNNEMNFTVIEGIVDPGEEGNAVADGTGSVTYKTEVSAETRLFTVIYELDEEAPASDNYEVDWEFSENGIWLADVNAPITYDDNLVIVETNEATGITETSAELNGNITYWRGYDNLDMEVYFLWRNNTGDEWNETVNQTLTSTGEFSETISGLTGDTTYEYKAVAGNYSGDVKVEGQILQFTTAEATEGVSSWYDLSAVRNELDAHYNLTADLDRNSAGYDELVDTEKGWDPIGTQGLRFNGTFDGNNHTISDLYINRSNEDNLGVFGHVGDNEDQTTINNTCIENATVTGERAVGTLIGRVTGNQDTLIEKSCAVNSSVNGTGAVGGLIGSHNSWRETQGGTDNPVLNQSFADVNVTDRENVDNPDKFGGLVGCSQKGQIEDSYALGNVTVENGGERIGGLAGCIDYRGIIKNSYSTGNVIAPGSDPVGALVGNIEGRGGNAGEVIYSYSNEETSGQTDLVGAVGDGDVTGGTRTTDQMTYNYGSNTYTDWDFDKIWLKEDNELVEDREGNSGYPALQWQSNR